MKKVFAALSFLLFVTTFLTLPVKASESDHFMSCSGAHHGWYLDFFAVSGHTTSEVVQLNVVVSTDADPSEVPYKVFTVHELSKNGAQIETAAYRWVLKEAVRKEDIYGYVKVKADMGPSVMYLNFNIFGDALLNHAVAIDGDIQSLTCQILGA